MKFSDKFLSQAITQLCLLYEIDHIVISPGSRNAALTIGFTEHPKFKNFSIVDERCAAFFALGLAQQLKKPVALVCTSGSALLNYYPAIAEAFYSDIPLVVISADRPADLIEIGDGQTIRQENVFSNHILYNANCIEGEINQLYNEKEIAAALRVATEEKGPVHINVPFSEPLYGTVSELQIELTNPIPKTTSKAITQNLLPFAEKWKRFSKKIVLVGVLAPGSLEQQFVDSLGADESVMVLTESTSNLHHENFFPAIDQLIAPLDEVAFRALKPDLLVTFGGMIVSKKIKVFLRTYMPKEHWHIDTKKAYDTFFCLKHHLRMTPNYFFGHVYPVLIKNTELYRSKWQLVKCHRLKHHLKFEKEVRFSDFKVFSEIFKSLPKQIQLQLSNSATIRYAQLFDLDPGLKVYCNRGTSGIDGSTSTAIGAAVASNLPTVFVTGDISFLYDSNALWSSYIPKNFRIIVVNNGGGGIFRILPGAKETDHFNQFFETHHSHSAKQLCEMFAIEYQSASNSTELQKEFKGFYGDSEGPKLLEIFTPSEENDKVLLEYFSLIK